MNAQRVEELIARWDAGDASPAEISELEGLLDQDADVRQRFARYFMEEAELFGVFREADGYKRGAAAESRLPSVSEVRSRRWFRSPGPALVAAFLIMALGGILLLLVSPEERTILVEEGTVQIEKKEVSTVPAGARIVVGSEAPAILRLPNDSRLNFKPNSVALVDRTRIHLFNGGVRLDRADADSLFEVTTRAGAVRSTGGDVAIEIRPAERGGETVVTVLRGEVTIVREEETVKLLTGDHLTFGGYDVVPNTRFAQLREFFQFDIFQLIQIAQNEVKGGVPVEFEVEEEDDGLELSVEFYRGGKLIEVKLDPRKGEVLHQEEENPDRDERYEDVGPDDLVRVLREALKNKPGIPWSIELERYQGLKAKVKIAKVKIAQATQSGTMRLNLASGSVIDWKKLKRFDDDD